jgi:hypothetical protein
MGQESWPSGSGKNTGSAIHVMLALRCGPSEVLVTDEHSDGTDRTDEFLGKRQRLTHQTGNALLQGVVEPLDVVGLRANLLIAWCLRWSSMANWRIVVPGAVLTSRPSGELGLGSHCPNGNGHT